MKTSEFATDNNVTRKTPEEIKKELACESMLLTIACSLDCDNCERYVPGYEAESCAADALAYIQQLEARLAQVERERDAAVNELKNSCMACRFVGKEFDDSPCEDCFQRCGKYPWSPMVRTKFEWRGICQENTKEE